MEGIAFLGCYPLFELAVFLRRFKRRTGPLRQGGRKLLIKEGQAPNPANGLFSGAQATVENSPPKRPIQRPMMFKDFPKITQHIVVDEALPFDRGSKNQEWPRQTKPKKGRFMNFSQGRSGTKVQCESCLFPKEKHQNSQKWAKFMNFSFWPFLWFGLPGRLLKKTHQHSSDARHTGLLSQGSRCQSALAWTPSRPKCSLVSVLLLAAKLFPN